MKWKSLAGLFIAFVTYCRQRIGHQSLNANIAPTSIANAICVVVEPRNRLLYRCEQLSFAGRVMRVLSVMNAIGQSYDVAAFPRYRSPTSRVGPDFYFHVNIVRPL